MAIGRLSFIASPGSAMYPGAIGSAAWIPAGSINTMADSSSILFRRRWRGHNQSAAGRDSVKSRIIESYTGASSKG